MVGWLFFVAWRGTESFQRLQRQGYNLLQVALIGITAVALGVLLTVVGEGLLGRPEMFIIGNGSSQAELRWLRLAWQNFSSGSFFKKAPAAPTAVAVPPPLGTTVGTPSSASGTPPPPAP